MPKSLKLTGKCEI